MPGPVRIESAGAIGRSRDRGNRRETINQMRPLQNDCGGAPRAPHSSRLPEIRGDHRPPHLSLVAALAASMGLQNVNATGTVDVTGQLPLSQPVYTQLIPVPSLDVTGINFSQDGKTAAVSRSSGLVDFYSTGPSSLTFVNTKNLGNIGMEGFTYITPGWGGVAGATSLALNANGTLTWYDNNINPLNSVLLPAHNYSSITFNFANNQAVVGVSGTGSDKGAYNLSSSLTLTPLSTGQGVLSLGYVHLNDNQNLSDLLFMSQGASPLSSDGTSISGGISTGYGGNAMTGFGATPDVAATTYATGIEVWQRQDWQDMITPGFTNVPVTPPVLLIAASESVTVTWTNSYPTAVLQSANAATGTFSDLTAGVDYQISTNANNFVEAVIPAAEPEQYFRLKVPAP